MTTKFLKNCKYVHRKCLDTYIEVLEAEDFEEHFSLIVVWRKKSNDAILTEEPHKICVLRNSLHEWNPWQK